mmetsp:Transcript_27811/g.59103  ORF Transcript_27811/g.59103 Transcript_27811/m.59103 type:complete len:452 (-) Transcript_27811:185-1540(-)
MHPNECLQLAFTRPSAYATDENAIPATANDLPFLADDSPTRSQQPQYVQGSIVAALKCIASDWATKSHTNFYIPDEHYPGYSYLFDYAKQSQWHASERKACLPGNIPSQVHTRHPAFVYAKEHNNLHSHHHAHNSSTFNIANINFQARDPMRNTVHISPGVSIPFSQNAESNMNQPMTVPYIHPHLGMPVPPLHLPWYFGALCWSFSLGGVYMLYIPAKWALCGGGRVRGKEGQHRRHWFPYHMFALALLFVQSPLSFLADYVHMTNISAWHAVDRIIACLMLSIEIVKLLVMCQYTRPSIYLAYMACIGAAIFCFLKSQKSQQTLNTEGFVFWHCGWHCYPIACALVYSVENFLNRRWGEYYAFEREAEIETDEDIGGTRGGISLSTTLMNYWNNAKEKQPNDQPDMSNNGTMERKKWKQIRKTRRDGKNGAPFTDITNTMSSSLCIEAR